MEGKIVIDSSVTLEHIGSIFNIVSKVPKFAEENARVSAIEVLPGGLTNFNFKVTIGGTPYAVRVAGKGTSEFVNRPAEHFNANLGADLGINSVLYFHDETTGDQVAEYVGDKTLHIPDFHEDPQWLVKTAAIMKKLHTCGKKLASRFDLLKEIDAYEKLVADKNVTFYDGAEKMRDGVKRIKAAYAKYPYEEKPCHNDTLAENWVVRQGSKDSLALIDWEYSGMNDPNFDLAAVSLENSLSYDEERVLLNAYYDNQVSDEDYGRVIINKFLADALWSLWSVLQIENGKPYDEYWPYGLNRFDRAIGFIEDGSLDKAIAALEK